MLPFYASPLYYINMSHPLDRKEAGHHRPDEDKGDAPKAKRPHNGSMFVQPNIVKGKGHMLIVSTI